MNAGVGRSSTDDADLDAILRTIREVEVSLERRFARAEAALLMIWALVGATIFGFYQLVEIDHGSYLATFGPALPWMWIGPMALGYVASAIVGARLGRIGIDEKKQRDFRRGAIPGLFVAILATALVVTERYHYIYGGVVGISGIALIAFAKPTSRTRTLSITLGAAMTATGIALLALADLPWAPGIAALTFLLAYLTLGTVKYRTGG